MKKRIAQTLLVAALLAGVRTPAGGGAPPGTRRQAMYRVTNLPPLGGTSSVGFSINDRGWVAGRSNLAGNQSRHATLWRNGGSPTSARSAGPNSAVLWPVKNLRGIVTGIAQTERAGPAERDLELRVLLPAATRTGKRCLGFKWEDGVMTRLPTLGGTHGFATGSNNLGQIVGWAENTVHDPTCVPPRSCSSERWSGARGTTRNGSCARFPAGRHRRPPRRR